MGLLGYIDLVAVFAVCGTALGYHALHFRYLRQQRADLVTERQEDARLAHEQDKRLAGMTAQADRVMEHAARAEDQRIAFDQVVSGLNTNFARIDGRLEVVEIGMGIGGRPS